ncbi:MAG: glycosyltransferase family 2 protein [Thiotrichaceae bacterium]
MKSLEGKMKVVAVIPCYNEEKTIADIVTRTTKYVEKVVVADDCSIDKTVDIALKAGATVVANEIRQGFGGNMLSGISSAMTNGKPDIVVTLDGDGQHNPDEIPRVIEPILKGQTDIVIGSRFMGDYDAPRYRKFGIDVITWLYNVGNEQKITDAQSCLRAYKREVLESVNLEEKGFGLSTEILVKARAKGFRIVEVPVSCIYHKEFSMNSSMNPIKHGLSVALCTIKWRLRTRAQC